MSLSLTEGVFFLSQSAQSSRSFLAHVSSPQKASGIQSSQSVTAKEDTNKEATSSQHPAHRGISVITPLPFGGGEGGGATISRNTNHSNSRCKDILQAVPFYIREQAELATRTCPSAFKNMLFLTQEERLQRARRACPRKVNVIR